MARGTTQIADDVTAAAPFGLRFGSPMLSRRNRGEVLLAARGQGSSSQLGNYKRCAHLSGLHRPPALLKGDFAPRPFRHRFLRY